jgi:hypothetical protein
MRNQIQIDEIGAAGFAFWIEPLDAIDQTSGCHSSSCICHCLTTWNAVILPAQVRLSAQSYWRLPLHSYPKKLNK